MPSSSHPPVTLRHELASFFLGFAFLASTGSAVAQGQRAGAASEPVFTALRTDGTTVAGTLAALGPDRLSLTLDEDEREDLPLRSLVKLTREVHAPPQSLDGSQIIFPDGDRLMRVIVGGTAETTLEVQSHTSLGKLRIPLDSVLGIVLMPPAEGGTLDTLWDRLLHEPRSTEVLWMLNGDRITGGLLGFDDRNVNFQIEGKPAEIDRTGVVAMGFDPAVTSYPRPPSDFLEVSLIDGSRLGLTGAHLEKGVLLATARFGQEVRIPVGEIARLDPRTPAVVYLTERSVDAHQYVSYIGPTRPFRADRSVEGHRLELNGRSYERGLGTQSRTMLAYRLKPGDQRFQALVGVDDRAGPLGSVVFRVVVDGKTRFTTPPLAARDTPQPVDVDLAQAKLLILITEFGDRGDVRDLADWAEARIIR